MKTHFAFIFTATLLIGGCQDKPASVEHETEDLAVASVPHATPAPAIPTTSLVRAVGKDELPSEPGVGMLGNGMISSTGKAGYLVYGPYAALDAGTYQVTLDGTFESLPEGSHATVDVVSNQGANILGSAEISSAPAAGAALADFVATVPASATDVEVRVFVPDKGRVSVSGYRVQPKQ